MLTATGHLVVLGLGHAPWLGRRLPVATSSPAVCGEEAFLRLFLPFRNFSGSLDMICGSLCRLLPFIYFIIENC